MRVSNPLEYEYSHANFQGKKVYARLRDSDTSQERLECEFTDLNGVTRSVQLQFHNNGTVKFRVGLSASSPIHVLVVDNDNSGATLFEQ